MQIDHRIDNAQQFFKDIPEGAQVHVYTDGACSGNPGPGGWGVVFVCGEQEYILNGGEQHTTNNRMEMMAALKALEVLVQYVPNGSAKIYTDSKYLMDGLTLWIKKWKQNQWMTSKKESVKNKDIWVMLDDLSQKYSVEWQWVKGHSGDTYNDLADTLARRFIISNSVQN